MDCWLGRLKEARGQDWATEGICVNNGGIYVAVNNAFAYGEEVGRIGRIDLETGAYTEVDLGPEGLNPVHLFADTMVAQWSLSMRSSTMALH